MADAVLAEVAKGKELKHVETTDKSAPVIEDGVKVGKNPLPDALKQIKDEKPALKHVETADKSAPVIDKNVKIGEAPQKAALKELQAAVAHKEVKKEIASGEKQLKHVETTDKSAPLIEKDVKLREAPQKKVLEEVKAEKKLKHVDDKDRHDASEPIIDPNAKVGQNPMKTVLSEVQTAAAHREVKKEIASGEKQLKHVETTDKSAPLIEKDVKLREAPQKKVLEEVKAEKKLKHVDDKDRHDASEPIIDPNAKVGEAPQKKVLADIAKGEAHLKHVEQ